MPSFIENINENNFHCFQCNEKINIECKKYLSSIACPCHNTIVHYFKNKITHINCSFIINVNYMDILYYIDQNKAEVKYDSTTILLKNFDKIECSKRKVYDTFQKFKKCMIIA